MLPAVFPSCCFIGKLFFVSSSSLSNPLIRLVRTCSSICFWNFSRSSSLICGNATVRCSNHRSRIDRKPTSRMRKQHGRVRGASACVEEATLRALCASRISYPRFLSDFHCSSSFRALSSASLICFSSLFYPCPLGSASCT